MFYRRKVLLALIQVFGGKLEKIRLQKLLFIFEQGKAGETGVSKTDYDFIPYKYGCFSYSANADLTAMVRNGVLDEDEKHFLKVDQANYLPTLTGSDLKRLLQLVEQFGDLDSAALMRYTYLAFPFYAMRSEMAQQLLSTGEYLMVKKEWPIASETILYTIGYEGISLETYLTRLLKHDIKVLVDVRNNPQSMKYGFSKTQLRKCCESIGVEYVHLPELGISSEQRQSLDSQADYDKLFEVYKHENLPNTGVQQQEILKLLSTKKRIALTCFEANICQCHRRPLAEFIGKLPEFKYQIVHI